MIAHQLLPNILSPKEHWLFGTSGNAVVQRRTANLQHFFAHVKKRPFIYKAPRRHAGNQS